MEKWEIYWTNTFTKLYNKKDKSIKVKVIQKLKELSENDPFNIGKKKKGLPYSFNPYAIKVDKSNRIVYEPIILQNGKKIIKLLKVCDHKKVYGHD